MITGNAFNQKTTFPYRVETPQYLAIHSRKALRIAGCTLPGNLAKDVPHLYRYTSGWLSHRKTLLKHLSGQVFAACRNTSEGVRTAFESIAQTLRNAISTQKHGCATYVNTYSKRFRTITDRTESLCRIAETGFLHRFRYMKGENK
jgi:hypothetical protein